MATKAEITGELFSHRLTKNTYKKVRKLVKESCGDMAELAVGEVLANALEHGSEAKLCLYIKPRRVEVTVTNSIAAKPSRKIKPLGVGGRGLSIVQQLASVGAIRRYDCTIQGSQHTTRLVLDRNAAPLVPVWREPLRKNINTN